MAARLTISTLRMTHWRWGDACGGCGACDAVDAGEFMLPFGESAQLKVGRSELLLGADPVTGCPIYDTKLHRIATRALCNWTFVQVDAMAAAAAAAHGRFSGTPLARIAMS
jgi:hypothetical protein